MKCPVLLGMQQTEGALAIMDYTCSAITGLVSMLASAAKDFSILASTAGRLQHSFFACLVM